MTVVDASPFIVFARANRFALLQELLHRAVIPRQVYDEVVGAGAGRPGAKEVGDAEWIEVVEIGADDLSRRRLPKTLGKGDQAAIVLALNRQLPLYSDDLAVRKAAYSMNLKVFGSLGLLEQAKRTQRLSTVRPVAEELVSAGLRIRRELYEAWLRRVAE